MEPKQEGMSGGIERAPLQTGEYNHAPQLEQLSQNPEQHQAPRAELGSVQAEAAQIAMPALPTPVLQQSQQDPAAQDDDAPLVANDDDLIEKEWVDKVKKILDETKDDPYKREREISKLQIEYIRKRYGREIGDSGD